MALSSPVLVVNQNYQPLNVCNARRAIVLIDRGKAELLANGRGAVHSVSRIFPVPSVIRLIYMVKRPLMRRRLSRQGGLLPRRLRLPVLRQGDERADARPHPASFEERGPRMGERRQRLHTLQPPQSRPDPQRGQHEAPQRAESPPAQPLLHLPPQTHPRRVAPVYPLGGLSLGTIIFREETSHIFRTCVMWPCARGVMRL